MRNRAGVLLVGCIFCNALQPLPLCQTASLFCRLFTLSMRSA
jgi:hypothetical protein